MAALRPLVILGVGGNCLDLLDAINEINRRERTYEVRGFLAPDPDRSPAELCGLPVLGAVDEAPGFAEDVLFAGFTFGTSTYGRWPGIIKALGLPQERFATIIHPAAYVSPQARMGSGSMVLSGVSVGAEAEIGDHVIILQNVGISHHDVIEDFNCICTGASFSGKVHVEKNCYIATNATVVGSIRIGEGSLIGAGSLIRHDVPPGEVWVGNPARKLRDA